MKYTSFIQGSQMTVALRGEIDHHGARDCIREIVSKIDSYSPRVCILDFEDVTFMDSSGIGVILGRYRQLRDRGGCVGVVNMNRHIARIFHMSGMDRIIRQYNDPQEAAQA